MNIAFIALGKNYLFKIPKNIIDEQGGEEYTSGLKKDHGKSKSDLYWDKEGWVYVGSKHGEIDLEPVDKIPRR